MDMIDDKFEISGYVDKDEKYAKNNKAIELARKWANDAMRVIILPTDTMEELENDWIAFNSMIKKNRRESDWKSIELFGATNQDRYEKYLHNFLKDDIEDDEVELVNESYIDTFTDYEYYGTNEIHYTTVEVERARKWGEESNRVIILPTRTLAELEQLWDSYQAMILKHRRESDWMSTELFGITNLKHYEYLKNQFLKEDINKNTSDKYGSVIEHTTSYDMSKYICELCNTSTMSGITKMLELSMRNNSIFEDRLISNVIDDGINQLDKASTVSINNTTPSDMPYFSPEDMIDMGIHSSNPEDNYYGAIADNDSIGQFSVEEWFEMYKNANDGFYTEFYKMTSQWVNTVRTLIEGLKNLYKTDDEYSINSRKQSILELGWNPDVEFTNRSRKIANECATARMNKNIVSKVIDLREFRTLRNENMHLNEYTSVNQLIPLFIVISSDKNMYSIYTAFDTSLESMNSFNINGEQITVNINKLDSKKDINVFAVFFTKDEYDRMQSYIKDHNNDKLYKSIFNTPKDDSDIRRVCAKFIYRLTKITSYSKNTIENADDAGRIYMLYTGSTSKYDKNKVASIMNSINRTASIKESSYIFSESGYTNKTINCMKSDISYLAELKASIDCLHKESAKKLLESAFDMLTPKAYRIGIREDNNSYVPKIDDINNIIFNNFNMI